MTNLLSNISILEELEERFTSKDVEWRISSTTKDKSKGMAVPYLDARAIQQRLDNVVGKGYWKNSYIPWHNGSQLCVLSLKVVYEDGSYEWIDKVDGADCSDIEPIKGGLSDSFKRAAVHWGIGRYLYEMPSIWVTLEDGRNIPKAEMERLNAFIDGDKKAMYSDWKGSNKQVTGNTVQANTDQQYQQSQGQSRNHQQSQGSSRTYQGTNTATATNRQTQNSSANGNTNSSNGDKPPISVSQIRFLRKLLADNGIDETQFISSYNVDVIEKLTIEEGSAAINKLKSSAA